MLIAHVDRICVCMLTVYVDHLVVGGPRGVPGPVVGRTVNRVC